MQDVAPTTPPTPTSACGSLRAARWQCSCKNTQFLCRFCSECDNVEKGGQACLKIGTCVCLECYRLVCAGSLWPEIVIAEKPSFSFGTCIDEDFFHWEILLGCLRGTPVWMLDLVTCDGVIRYFLLVYDFPLIRGGSSCRRACDSVHLM